MLNLKRLKFSRMLSHTSPTPGNTQTISGSYNGEDGFAITVGLMEYISGWSALEILYWLNEKQAIPRRYDNENRRTKRTQSRAGVSG